MGPEVAQKLLKLRSQHPEIESKAWGFEEISKVALSLPEDDLIALLGGIIAPTNAEIRDVTYDDLKIILTSIARQPQIPDSDVRPVPPGKLAENRLLDDSDSAYLLRLGMLKSDRVRKFLADWPDPNFANEITRSFSQEYRGLHNANLLPDVVFQELLVFAGGLGSETTPHRGAVLAVLAYLFEECHIFERPEERAS